MEEFYYMILVLKLVFIILTDLYIVAINVEGFFPLRKIYQNLSIPK